MDTLKTAVVAPQDGPVISDQDGIAAMRYIDAIVGRAPIGSAYADHADLRRRDLWDRFVLEYRSASTGPYARHDGAALRLALGRI